MNYPIVYVKKSDILNSVTMALVVEKPNVWKLYYPGNEIIDAKDSGWPIEAFNNPKTGLTFIPSSMFNRLGETLKVYENPAQVIIDDIIKEVTSLTKEEVATALEKQYKAG